MAIVMTVSVSGTTSQWVDTQGAGINGLVALCGLVTPAEITSTSLAFEYSEDGANALALYDSAGAAVAVTVAASQYVQLDPAKYACIPRYFRIKAGTSEGSARLIKVYAREV
jgi:hypothetical protein